MKLPENKHITECFSTREIAEKMNDGEYSAEMLLQHLALHWNRVEAWGEMSDSDLRLRCGELTAQEIRTVRAVLTAILANAAGQPCAAETATAVVTSDWLGSLWRPIETAPKDSTPVDLWVPDSEERLANYVRVERSPTNVFYDPAYAGTCCVRNASHWMPLPSAPNAADEQLRGKDSV